ncbi:MAG: hypothetical protein LBI87_13640 [Candidatus Accumulibacter sp.]|nr:hypothetical protein [Accumulibacter sp.]
MPKTWIGRGIALFPALAFVYIDWQTIGQLEANNWMGLGGAVIMFWLHVSLLVLYTVAAAIREASSKVSLALLFAIWFVSIFFKKLLLS